jgi:hypothetical protein
MFNAGSRNSVITLVGQGTAIGVDYAQNYTCLLDLHDDEWVYRANGG